VVVPGSIHRAPCNPPRRRDSEKATPAGTSRAVNKRGNGDPRIGPSRAVNIRTAVPPGKKLPHFRQRFLGRVFMAWAVPTAR
jgi:hypothetical protein